MTKREYERIRQALLRQRKKVNGREWGKYATFWSDLPSQNWQKSLTSAPIALLNHFGKLAQYRRMSKFRLLQHNKAAYEYHRSIALAGPGDKLP
jgi:hypothetical protein